MDYSKKTQKELIAICKENGIKGYSNKTKEGIIQLLVEKPNPKTDESKADESKADEQKTDEQKTDEQKADEQKADEQKADEQKTDEPTVKPESKLKLIDLFAGTGAFTYAFTQLRIENEQSASAVECVFANDMAEMSKKVYDANFDHKLFLKDINDIDVKTIPNHSILTGGFPCQPFSIAGNQEGFRDVRANVFWKILEIIDHHNPPFVILENVKNLVSHDDGKTFETIRKNLTDRNYHIRYKVLDTSEITGIPQHRERIYIVCIKSKEIYDQFSLDFENKVKLPISQMLEATVDKKYYYTDKSSTWGLVSKDVVKKNTVYQYRRVYVRENKNGNCPTLTANMGTGGHNVPLILDDTGIRKLTPRECFNFQGFPQTYKLPAISDANLYKLAGNAVSVPVVELIANRLLSLILRS
jgi:DNA (cytosine-5)-methyltransferase 1